MLDTDLPFDRRPTRALPRADLKPVSTTNLAELDADEEPMPETMVPCPWCAKHGGLGAVPTVVRKDWLGTYAELNANEIVP